MKTLFRVIRVAEDLEAVSHITTRKDFERWRNRAKARRKFLLTAYLIGAVPVFVGGVLLLIAALIHNREHLHSIEPAIVGFISSLLCAIVCGGPFILVPCAVLLFVGLNSYSRVLATLESNGRVCGVCQAVAMFGDTDINPSQSKKHTKANLVPHMNVIKEDGQTHVLCDVCLAEVNAIDAVK